jgi:hypothetical protein
MLSRHLSFLLNEWVQDIKHHIEKEKKNLINPSIDSVKNFMLKIAAEIVLHGN